ncbi:ribosomal protein L7/L12 [Streptomyces thermoviolaceus]|jgi:ribosomal protein L7/L12|uniref:Large ribosomal subunit protein bL12 C-terminal domain-containing protein n=1 Tax=Streptomyces thermoviolaceus subsp. thermoviolaceus TaxID=66860 RepID=A0ABX0YX26_STRTL|nr:MULTISPECIES: ribosomal protein L7/L12 [Streptomyces]MCM3265921.1 ribosomal protein L7/L12 [Streptomyces thermoviolaceus]NJP17192.1 hypothetical protein [Streptomyces thermoviolaceus subsp. thermoviolaceus]RSR98997.1 hypothetical protein EF917_19880 [Streptomyces sp. WAC00469]WTD48343.1 ribosomal protein L7/L12 [Streptomyces thermoviolaceus]GGV72484.1 hypothetical protein GCM10010499_24610 [Streptomyces thermoviolaceus subsp. apingens]
MDTTAVALIVTVLVVQFASIGMQFSRSERRVARLEHKLDQIMAHLGLQDDDPRLQQVHELARTGRQIEAIKVYREVTGAGLKEAKDAVDRMVA